MRILALIDKYPPHAVGGYERSCQDVVQGLERRGHQLMVLTSGYRLPGVADPPHERTQGVRRDLVGYFEHVRRPTPSFLRRLAIERANHAALAEAIAAARPSVVSVWNMGGMSLSLLAAVAARRLPTVFVVCDDWLAHAPRNDPWLRTFDGRPLAARASQAATGIPTTVPDLDAIGLCCFVSAATRRRARTAPRWTPRRSAVVYGGISRTDFPRIRPARRAWDWQLLYVGRLSELKGVTVAVDGLGLLPATATLRIVGRGEASYVARLRERAQRLRMADRVAFSHAERSWLRHHYAAADVVLFPSLWEEPFGLVPLEAMACGTPVVATGTGGAGEYLIHEVNCLLVAPGDAAGLAAAVYRLAADQALRERLVGGGLVTADRFDIDSLTAVLEHWHLVAMEQVRSSISDGHATR